jgi:hypothetical protein
LPYFELVLLKSPQAKQPPVSMVKTTKSKTDGTNRKSAKKIKLATLQVIT